MGYDSTTNSIRPLEGQDAIEWLKEKPQLTFTEGEEVTVKGVVFKIHEVGHTRLILKPVRQS